MNRQEVAVAVVKINKATKMLRYWLGLGEERYTSVLDPELSHLATWIRGIKSFLKVHPDETVYEMLGMICTDKDIRLFIERYGNVMPKKVKSSLLTYLPVIKRLLDDGKKIHEQSKGEYRGLVDGLDNDIAKGLLDRARGIKVLDKHYKPLSDINKRQLKMIAYAVIQHLGGKHPLEWGVFNKQWSLSGKKSLYKARLLNLDDKDMRLITELYPEVDFSPLFAIHDDIYFNTELSDKDLGKLYRLLVENGYVSKETPQKDFLSMFSPINKGTRTPVRWIMTQRQLSFFVYHMFKKGNETTMWLVAQNCFSLNGRRANRDTMSDFLTKIKKWGMLDNYDAKLFEIMRPFM